MPNIIGGRLNVIHAKENGTPAELGFTSSNIRMLYEMMSKPPASFNPNSSFNSLTTITKGNGYLVDALTDQDNPNFYPPFPQAIFAEDGQPILPE